MADIDVDQSTSMPAGIPTFHMIYRAIDKLIKRVDKLEEKITKLEITPQPAAKIEAVGKEITEKKVKK